MVKRMDATFPHPKCLGRSKAAREAWQRATAGLPDHPPADVLEMATQIATLILRENKFRRGRYDLDEWKPADWERALRDTIALRVKITKDMNLLLKQGGRVGRTLPGAEDPAANRSEGIAKMIGRKHSETVQ